MSDDDRDEFEHPAPRGYPAGSAGPIVDAYRDVEMAITHHSMLLRAGRYGSPEWWASYDRQEAALEALIAAGNRDHAVNLARWADDGGQHA